MKQVIAGDGSDSTAAVKNYLTGNKLWLKTLYLIGDRNDPNALWLTDYEAPLKWGIFGTFKPAVITRSTVSTKIGLEVTALEIDWTPKSQAFTQSVSTTSPLHLAQLGIYDNWPFQSWTVFMPTPGDANTFGACPLFGGRIADTIVDRSKIHWTVNSFLDVINQLIPTNVIENANTQASYAGATPPRGFSKIPYFNTFTGSGNTLIYGDVVPPFGPGHLFTKNIFQSGYLVFIDGPGATLAHLWSPIGLNATFKDGFGVQHNAFTIYKQLPWPPVPWNGTSGDRFYVSAPYAVTQADASAAGVAYIGFPSVPSPEQAVGSGAASKDP